MQDRATGAQVHGALRMAQSAVIFFANDKADHDEFTLRTGVLTAFGKIAILTIVPCLQCGHWNRERPVSCS